MVLDGFLKNIKIAKTVAMLIGVICTVVNIYFVLLTWMCRLEGLGGRWN